jgi:hypothetical protein
VVRGRNASQSSRSVLVGQLEVAGLALRSCPVTERGFRLDVRTGNSLKGLIRQLRTHKVAHSPIRIIRLLGPHPAVHHVWPTMPPSSACGHALCASFARKPQCYANSAHLFRCVKSKSVWSPWSSFKVGTANFYTHQYARLTLHRRPGQLSSQRIWTLEQTRSYAETVVKVPEMAESITEGTLKQWSKRAFSRFGIDYMAS